MIPQSPPRRWRANSGKAWDVDTGGRQLAVLDEVMNPDSDLVVGDLVGRTAVVAGQIGDAGGVGLLSAFGPATNGQTTDELFSQRSHRPAPSPIMTRLAAPNHPLRAAASFNTSVEPTSTSRFV